MSTLLAHISADHGFTGGLLHPLTGLDHLLAMIAVGLFAARVTRPMVPVTTFVGAMALGLFSSLGLAPIELGLALSVVALGLLVVLHARSGALPLVLIGVAGLLHGHAHGAESVGPALPFAAGALLSTLALHLAGVVIARHVRVELVRLGGGLIAMAGLVFAFA